MHKPVRWGILGAGNIANKFSSAINFTANAEVYAVASRDKINAEEFGRKYGASKVFDDYRYLAEDPDVDIIYIATPHAFHHDQALMCIENGKAVLCEKPMALSRSQVSEMAEAARKKGVFLMEGMWSRFMPSINKVQEMVNEDVIGPIMYFRADFGFQAPIDPGNRLYNLQLGGGSILDVGVYPIFLSTLLLGEPVDIQAMAKLAQTGADESCSMQFRYAQGQMAHLFSSISVKTALTAEITGPKGRISLHCPFYKATHISLELHDSERKDFYFPHEHNGFEYEVREVVKCLDGNLLECPGMTLATSLQMATIMDTVREQCGVRY